MVSASIKVMETSPHKEKVSWTEINELMYVCMYISFSDGQGTRRVTSKYTVPTCRHNMHMYSDVSKRFLQTIKGRGQRMCPGDYPTLTFYFRTETTMNVEWEQCTVNLSFL